MSVVSQVTSRTTMEMETCGQGFYLRRRSVRQQDVSSFQTQFFVQYSKFMQKQSIPISRAPRQAPPPQQTQQRAPVRSSSQTNKPVPPPVSEKKPVASVRAPIPKGPKAKQPVQQEESKDQQPKTGLFTEKPSAKLTGIKTIDPFADKSKQKTNSFAYVYNAGGIPCRVNHGCSVMRLQWNNGVTVDSLSYDPLLVTCFDGLIEEGHPFSFIAFNAIKEMLEDQSAPEKVIPMVSKLVWPLRQALSSKSDKVFDSALQVLKLFSNTVGSHINGQVKNLVVPLTKRMDKKNYRDPIYDVLRSLEENGGPEAYKAIKGAIPTYSNM